MVFFLLDTASLRASIVGLAAACSTPHLKTREKRAGLLQRLHQHEQTLLSPTLPIDLLFPLAVGSCIFPFSAAAITVFLCFSSHMVYHLPQNQQAATIMVKGGGHASFPQSASNNERKNVPDSKRKRSNDPWTPAEEQLLKKMRDMGHSWSEIAMVGSQSWNVIWYLGPCSTRTQSAYNLCHDRNSRDAPKVALRSIGIK